MRVTGPKTFVFIFATTFGVVLAIALARWLWFDPFWYLKERPPWFQLTKGHNRLIDLNQRQARVLHLMTRDVGTVLVGSSTVYRGLDPELLAQPTYNAGLSAMVSRELPIVAEVIASRPKLATVLIGLDYFSFTGLKFEGQMRDDDGTPIGRARAVATSFLSLRAVRALRESAINDTNDRGAWWTYHGFRTTPARPPVQTLALDENQRKTLGHFDPASIGDLERTLHFLKDRHVTVFLQPTSAAQRRVMHDLGLDRDLREWRAAVVAACKAAGVRFLDLSDLLDADDFDPSKGSSDTWGDNVHYTAPMGAVVLEKLSLPLKH